MLVSFFFFNDPATTEIYTLSLHDALPICRVRRPCPRHRTAPGSPVRPRAAPPRPPALLRAGRRQLPRSEEHTSELQSRQYIVCRLLLVKKNLNSTGVIGRCEELADLPQHT